MLILSNEDIEKILPVGACLDVLEEAYRDLGNGMAATVPRYDVFSPTKPDEFYEYKTMSGVWPNRNVAALRLNSSVVKWYEKAGSVRKDKLPVAGGAASPAPARSRRAISRARIPRRWLCLAPAGRRARIWSRCR